MDAAEIEERRARARAMWGYSGKKQKAFADEAGIHPDRLRASMRDARVPAPTTDELLAMVTASGVPREFALDGWTGLARLEERLARVEAALSASDHVDYTRVATDEGRLATGAAMGTASVGESKRPAQTARDEADATAGEPQVPGQGTPHSEPGAAG